MASSAPAPAPEPQPPERPLLFAIPSNMENIGFLRLWREGGAAAVPSWIRQADVYGHHPAELFLNYESVTAADGSSALYLITNLRHLGLRDPRISRVAAGGTWKGERAHPLVSLPDRVHLGTVRSLSFTLPDTDGLEVRTGHLMKEYLLPLVAGTHGHEEALCVIYPTPRDPQLAAAKALEKIASKAARAAARAASRAAKAQDAMAKRAAARDAKSKRAAAKAKPQQRAGAPPAPAPIDSSMREASAKERETASTEESERAASKAAADATAAAWAFSKPLHWVSKAAAAAAVAPPPPPPPPAAAAAAVAAPPPPPPAAAAAAAAVAPPPPPSAAGAAVAPPPPPSAAGAAVAPPPPPSAAGAAVAPPPPPPAAGAAVAVPPPPAAAAVAVPPPPPSPAAAAVVAAPPPPPPPPATAAAAAVTTPPPPPAEAAAASKTYTAADLATALASTLGAFSSVAVSAPVPPKRLLLLEVDEDSFRMPGSCLSWNQVHKAEVLEDGPPLKKAKLVDCRGWFLLDSLSKEKLCDPSA